MSETLTEFLETESFEKKIKNKGIISVENCAMLKTIMYQVHLLATLK